MYYDQIQPNLFLGSYPHAFEDLDALKSVGITAVLSLQSDEDCGQLGIDWPRLQADYAERGIEARRVSIRDFDDEALRRGLPVAVRELGALLDDGHVVYVHCTAGINRSPSAIICYLHWVLQWDLEEAIDHVLRCHSCDPVLQVIEQATQDRRGGAV